MVVRVQLFAMLRERVGAPHLDLELPDGAQVSDALKQLVDITGDMQVVLAVNRDYAAPDRRLEPGDELALIPPVSGGSPSVHVSVTDQPISVDAGIARVADPASGAIVTFSGVTREIAHLDYEAYVEMAIERLREIAEAAVVRHGLLAASVEHRVGRVGLGEPSVVVAVSAPHRPEAFAGAREIIDAVKVQAPIWKREDSGKWVEGTTPHA